MEISNVYQSWRQRVLRCKITGKDIPLIVKNVAVLLMAGYLFYGSFFASFLLFPLIAPWFVIQKEKLIKSENRELGIQFKDAMMAVSTAQKAGYSIENSFVEAESDMKILYGKRSPIVRELKQIEQGIKNNVSVETMIREMGRKSANKDIEEFAGVFMVAKRTGGNMTETIERCVNVIGKRMEVREEIEVMIAAKRMEARIMEAVPFGIMFYVGFTNPGFFKPLYGNLFGIAVMTLCLITYIAAYLLSEKIVDIEV